jgi:hypothetical protein
MYIEIYIHKKVARPLQATLRQPLPDAERAGVPLSLTR